MFGAIALGGAPGNLAWLANPLLFGSWLCTLRARRRYALVFGAAGFLFALLFAYFPEVMDQYDGGTSLRTDLLAGYWLWILSMLVSFVAALFADESSRLTRVARW